MSHIPDCDKCGRPPRSDIRSLTERMAEAYWHARFCPPTPERIEHEARS